jgi:glycosyltransferase 2 family protein
MTPRVKRLLQASIGLLFAVVFLGLALYKIDFSEFWVRLKAVKLWTLPLILLTYVAFFWLRAVRWSWLVRPIKPLGTKDVLPALMIGYMSNNILPAHLGEFVRMFVLARQYGLKNAAVLSTIVLERLFDFLVIVAIFAVTLQFTPPSDEAASLRTAGRIVGAACLLLFAVCMVFVWKTTWALGIADKLLFVLPRGPRGKALGMIRLIVQGFLSLRNPWLLLATILISLTGWAINGLSLYFSIIAFPLEHPIPLHAGLLLMAFIALAIALPSLPGYVGTTQACFVYGLKPFGISDESALAASIYANVVGYIPVTLAGFFFLARLGLTLHTIRSEAERVQDEQEAAPAETPPPSRELPP